MGSEDIPEIDTAVLRMALTQMKNRKTPQEKTTLQQKWGNNLVESTDHPS